MNLAPKFFTKVYLAIAVLSLLTATLQQVAVAEDLFSSQSYETEIQIILDSLKGGDLAQALEQTEQHIVEYPSSLIAHLIKADIYYAMTFGLENVGHGVSQDSKSLNDLQHQIKNRWQQSEASKLSGNELIPASLVDLGKHHHVIVADLKAGRLYLYKNANGQPALVSEYYLTVGSAGYGKEVEGDKKTPVGVYAINSHIPAEKLPDLYGDGAFPVNYPNQFDRFKKRTGSGIWLHGTPSYTYARSPWASKGCFVLSNDDLQDIQRYISVKQQTPVILSDEIKWLDAAELRTKRKLYLGLIKQWHDDWQSLNIEAYLSHYSGDNFNFGKGSFASWASNKRQVNQSKTFIEVKLDIESVFDYPGEEEMFVVQFKQDYKSSNYSSQSLKQQYWQRDSSGSWKIIFEG